MNTHFDDRSDDQRRLGASLILHRAQYEAEKTKGAVIVIGDFNRFAFCTVGMGSSQRSNDYHFKLYSAQTGVDSGAYEIITGVTRSAKLPSDFLQKFPISAGSSPFTMVDLKGTTPRERISGHYATFTGEFLWV